MKKLFCLLLTLCLACAPLCAGAEGEPDYESIALGLARQIADRIGDSDFRAVYVNNEKTLALWDEWGAALAGEPGKITCLDLEPLRQYIRTSEETAALSAEGLWQLESRLGSMFSSSVAGQAGTDFLVASSGLQIASYFPAQEVKAELWILPYGPVDVAVSFFGAGQGVGGAQASLVPGGQLSALGGEMMEQVRDYFAPDAETADEDWYERQAGLLAARVGALCGDRTYLGMVFMSARDQQDKLDAWREQLPEEPKSMETVDPEAIQAALRSLVLSSGGSEDLLVRLGGGSATMLVTMANNRSGEAQLVALCASLTVQEHVLAPEGYGERVMLLRYEDADLVVTFLPAGNGVCGAVAQLCLPGSFEAVLAETAQNP